MATTLKINCNLALKRDGMPCWYIADGDENYMREDGTWHIRMMGDGGTYFSTRQEAERVAAKFSGPKTPKTWGEMTDAEKGALLLGKHEGATIEGINPACPADTWRPKIIIGVDHIAYRARPPEPVRTMISLYGYADRGYFCMGYATEYDTHRITFDTIDGDPDPDSIRMERIND